MLSTGDATEDAKRYETRTRRIEKAIAELAQDKKS